jgi:hypothetical protein
MLYGFSCETAFSQSNKSTSSLDPAIKHAMAVYYRSLVEQEHIYNGIEYVGYPHPLKGVTPFFESDKVTSGAIDYDGIFYKNVPMWYDIVKDQVVIRYADSVSRVALHNEKIAYFSIFNHLFINIRDTSKTSVIPSGFYDQVYAEETQVLVKRSKGFVQEITDGIFVRIFNRKNEYYLKKEGAYFPVSNLASALKALGSNQKELKAQFKASKIRFKKDAEKAIVSIATHYDQINKGL